MMALDHSAIRAGTGSPLLKVMDQLRVLFSHAMMALDHSAIRAGTGSPLLKVMDQLRVLFSHAMMALDHSAIRAGTGPPLLKVMDQLRVLFSHAMPMMVGDRHECYDAWEAAMAKGITVGELPRPICLIKNKPKT